MHDVAHRIATELLGLKKDGSYYVTPNQPIEFADDCVCDFDPENNPADATMVMEKLVELNLAVLIARFINRPKYQANIDRYTDQDGLSSFIGEGDTWHKALCNAVIAWLDRDKNETS